MVALVALIVWRVPIYLVIPLWFIFACFDGTFLSAALTKVPEGAWFTLALSVLLSCIFLFWRFGKEQQWRAEAIDRIPPSHMIHTLGPEDDHASPFSRKLKLSPAFGGKEISRIEGMGIFFDKSGLPSTTPFAFIHFVQKFHAASDVIIFFHLRALSVPTVAPDERVTVSKCYIGGSDGNSKFPMPDTYRVMVRHGYNDEIVTKDLGGLLCEEIRNFLIHDGVEDKSVTGEDNVQKKETTYEEKQLRHSGSSGRPSFENEGLAAKLAQLEKAYKSQVVYVVGKEQMRTAKAGFSPRKILRKGLLELFLWVRENTRTKVRALNVPADKIVEVGFVKEI
jgi:KUP system potassium uptake protein